jgi:hypothetical protein
MRRYCCPYRTYKYPRHGHGQMMYLLGSTKQNSQLSACRPVFSLLYGGHAHTTTISTRTHGTPASSVTLIVLPRHLVARRHRQPAEILLLRKKACRSIERASHTAERGRI